MSRIAVIGTGISGMLAAHLLSEDHEVTVFEANDYIGGHTNTIEVASGGRVWPVDTGFIVFNDWTYPNFIRLLDRLGVASRPAEMSFSVRCERTGLEYSGSSLNTLYIQRSNLLRPAFHGMLLDILRFNRDARRFIASGDDTTTMSGFLRQSGYGRRFNEHYLIPMMAAIWSADPARIEDFPARHFLKFFENHGLLNIINRPQWRVIQGGSQAYVSPLTARYRGRVRLNSPVERVTRGDDGVEVAVRGGQAGRFDHVVIAAHSDQALRMLGDPSDAERDILGAIPYQRNEAVLHTDRRMLPSRRGAWAAWNYHLGTGGGDRVALTYSMNILQSLDSPEQFCVTLNDDGRIDPSKVIRRITYHHPSYGPKAVAAQARRAEISGVRRTHYCGAYWGYGFHEDGVNSALAVASAFGRSL